MNSRIRNTPERTAQMLNALLKAPRTYDQLEAASELNKPAVATWVKAMRAAGHLHISGWVPDCRGRMFTPVFAWGAGTDVKRAGQARTSAERMRAYRKAAKGAAK